MKPTPNQPPADDSAFTAAPCSVLRLTLKRKWFDMIASGEKKEEYRAAGKWILSRLVGKDYRPRQYDVIEFKNGYGKDVPTMVVEFLGWKIGTGREEWGAETGRKYATIQIGKVISLQNH